MTNQDQIAVFGATGKVGKELVNQLSQAGLPTLAITRNKDKATPMPYIQWIEADMNNISSIEKVLQQSQSVFLASNVNPNFTIEQNNVVSVAVKNGVRHIVKLSSPDADKNSENFIARPNGEVEEYLKTSGRDYTILQPNTFMQNWLGYFSETIQKERKIYEATGDGKKPFLDTRDIAACAAIILTKSENHKNKTYLLTGGEAVSYGQVAEAISLAVGEPVNYVSMTSEQARERMKGFGMPDIMINTFVAIAEGQRHGKADFVNKQVEELLGRKPITIQKFAKDYVQFFK
jgi:uncharacterized protein YbjT (DUF2867 family)